MRRVDCDKEIAWSILGDFTRSSDNTRWWWLAVNSKSSKTFKSGETKHKLASRPYYTGYDSLNWPSEIPRPSAIRIRIHNSKRGTFQFKYPCQDFNQITMKKEMFQSKNPSQLNLKGVISTKTGRKYSGCIPEGQGNGGTGASTTLQKCPHDCCGYSLDEKRFRRAPGFVQANPIQSPEQKGRKGGWPLWLETAPWKPCEEMCWRQETLNWIQPMTQGDGNTFILHLALWGEAGRSAELCWHLKAS